MIQSDLGTSFSLEVPSHLSNEKKGETGCLGFVGDIYLENLVYHFFRQLWLVLGGN